jgi:hypothetical protein
MDPEDTPALSTITKADGARGTITVQLLDALKRTVEGLLHLKKKQYQFQVEHISTLRLENLFGTMRENPSAGNYPTALEYVRVYSKSIKELLKKSLNGQYAFLYSTWVRTRRYNQPTPLANGRASILDILPKKSRIHKTSLRKSQYRNPSGSFNTNAFRDEQKARDSFVESLYTLLAILGKPVRQNRIRALSKHVAGVMPYSVSYVHRDLGRTPPREIQPSLSQDEDEELLSARHSDLSARNVGVDISREELSEPSRPLGVVTTDDSPYRHIPPMIRKATGFKASLASNTRINPGVTGTALSVISAPRGRGRPKNSTMIDSSTTVTSVTRVDETDAMSQSDNNSVSTVPRGRGRPKGSLNKSTIALSQPSATPSVLIRERLEHRAAKRPLKSAMPLIDETVHRKGDIVVSKSGDIFKLGSHIYRSRTNQTLRPAEVQCNRLEIIHEPGWESARDTKWQVSRTLTTLRARDIRNKRNDFEPDKFVADVYHSRTSVPAYASTRGGSLDSNAQEEEEEEIDEDEEDEEIDKSDTADNAAADV